MDKTCEVCQSLISPQARLCRRCRKLVSRHKAGTKPDKEVRIRALKEAWKNPGFYCYYSGVKLVEDNARSPRYLTFDHRTPRKENDIVVCAGLVNDMKSDLDETEFWETATKLVDYHRCQTAPLDENAFDRLRFLRR